MTKRYFRSDYSKYPSKKYENAVCIPLTKGRHTIIDVDKYEYVAKYMWHTSGGGYVARSSTPLGRGEKRVLHHELCPCPKGMVRDHINGDIYDNRICNIRICTHKQNMGNQRKRKSGTSCAYKGVILYRKGKWVARCAGRYLGVYNDPIQAARAYDFFALAHYGEYAHINFPLIDEEVGGTHDLQNSTLG